MFSAGLFIALGLTFIWFKLEWKWRLWMNTHPILIDCLVFAGLTALHWGTYTGVMAATIGALACSVMLSISRMCCGYYSKKNGVRVYVRGKFNLKGMPE